MNKEQLQKIKRATKHEYIDIVKMNDIVFWREITSCLAKGSLTPAQHKWLDKERTGHGLDQTTLDCLNIFGGKII